MKLRVMTLALVALMAIPVGMATWGGKGQYEPDTTWDKPPFTYMWQNPDAANDGVNRVYFNAYTQQNTGYSTHGFDFSANLATVQMERQSWPGNLAALLGIWKDCNGDGYIGWGDQGLMEYRSELLTGPLDRGICPADTRGQSPPPGPGSHSWSFASVHNDGIWVREFIPIGPDATTNAQPDANPFDINDNDARVWGDWGTPGALPPATSCGIVFIPEHSFHSTGGLVYYADCADGYVVTDESSALLVAAGQGGLSFADHSRDQYNSASPLNVPNPWGDPGGSSDVTVWECGPGTTPLTPHERVNDVYEFQVSQPSSNPNPNTGGSIGGTVNHTATGADDCDQSDNYKGDWENSAAQGIYGNEGKARPNSHGIRFQSDFPMAFNEGLRPLVGVGLPSVPGGRAMAEDSTRRVDTSGIWVSGTRIAEDRNPYLNRDTMLSAPIAGPQYITTYASIGGGAQSTWNLQFPGTSPGIYGAEACNGQTSGEWGSWKCATSDWPDCANADGYQCNGLIAGNANADVTVKVGAPYQVRDVDCYDTSVMGAREAGVGWGTLTGAPECV